MAVAFHAASTTPPLACDECGCVVDGTERGRASHHRWHADQDQVVIDLTAARERLHSTS